MDKKEVYSNDYISVFDDWTIWLSDWVWYIATLSREEVLSLYLTLKDTLTKD